MLTDDLTTMMRDRAGDVTAAPLAVLDGIEHKRIRRHRRRVVAATSGAVIATAAVGVAAALLASDAGSDRGGPTPVTSPSGIPCAEPTRSVPSFVDWPCPTAPVTHYDQQEFDQMRHNGAIAYGGEVPSDDLQYRVLAFGPLPNSRQGSTVVLAEVWQRDGDTPAKYFESYASPDTLYPGHLPRPRTGRPLPQMYAGGRMPAGDPAMFVASPPTVDDRTTLQACNREIQKPPPPHTGYAEACTDTVFARPGITAIRVVRPSGRTDDPIPVQAGLAGLDRFATGRRGWSIQGLDGSGHVVATVPYKTAF